MKLMVTKLKENLFVVLVACALAAMFPANGWAFVPGSGDPPAGKQAVPDRVIVKFKKGTLANSMAGVHAKFHTKSMRRLEALSAEVVDLPGKRSPKDLEALVEQYRQDPNVEYAEIDGIATVLDESSDIEPPEPAAAGPESEEVMTRGVERDIMTAGLGSVTGIEATAIAALTDDSQYNQLWGLKKIMANYAWRYQVGSSRVLVAVVDTGVDYTHEDLAGTVINGWDFVNNDADARDDHGHGTHVAGTIAATINNNKGIAGVSPNVQILAVKVLSASGSGSWSGVANGIVYAANRGAKVINLSLGGGASLTVKAAVDYAWSKGALVACAAGNSGPQQPIYPAAYPSCLAVGATDQNDQRASFSNYAPEGVAAPGVLILSTFPGNQYRSWNGTSMATPHVAGVAALIFSNDSYHRTNVRVRQILTTTTQDIGAPGKDPIFGYGRINAWRAVLSP